MNMIFLSQSIKRTLERIEQTIENDIKNGIVYPSTVAINKVVHVGSDTTEMQLRLFKEFRKSLEEGTNKLMQCDDIDREKAMLKIIDAIWCFYEPFTGTQISNIENDAVIGDGLVQKLEKFFQANKTDTEARALKNFFNNPCASSWGQEDSWCGIREFKLVKSKQEYNIIIKNPNITDITTDTQRKTRIRLAFYSIAEEKIIKEKGLYRDYIRFMYEYLYLDDALEKYKLWYDIRKKGIYYVYIPNVIN